ncbi:MAG: hypothetical protein AAGK32_06270, partial [Actinomycetota bacterium]
LDLDFTLVEAGTTEDEFVEAIGPVIFEGGSFPPFMLNSAGAVLGESAVVLEPGDYIVWSAGGTSEDDTEDPTVDDIVTTTLTVSESDAPAELPESDNTITARDFSFDVDVSAGEGFNFANDGPDQYHHAVVFNFGASDPAVVEENVVPFFASDDGALPEGIEVDFTNFNTANTAVFGPGSSGSGVGTFESGNTYAVVCFIQNLDGGEPHLFGENMFEVFTVE